MPTTKELKRLIRIAQKTACENGTCDHKFQYEHCPNHDDKMWCQDCVSKPKLVSQRMPDGSISQGYILGNLAETL